MPYEPLHHATPDALERELLELWAGEGLFQRTLDATRDGEPFVFFEGPPTANGRPGIHHVFSRTIKDLICRYRAMQGRAVTRRAGWDTHGLPVEIEVEKALQISGKADIEKFGIAEFNRRCRESVFKYKSDWEALSNRIGYWLDYDHPYASYTPDYVESVWWLLRQLADRDLLYEGHKVLPYCMRCGTALSSHELAQGYETHRSPSIHALFRLARPPGGHEASLLVWTTTPWTLPSNVAVAVRPDFTYVELDVDGRHVIAEESIARHRVIPGATHGKPLGEFPVVRSYRGTDLVGLRYEQLLDAVPVDAERAFRVIAGDFVTDTEGTGLVHLAPAFGSDDYEAVTKAGLAFVNPVDATGRFTGTQWDAINGRTVFEANPLIAERLAGEGKLFGRYEPQGYEHTYPFCWRCHSPLIYYARKSWFVRTTAFRDRMLAANKSVDWHPAEVGSGRFGEWLENNVDWALSRDRYWGTPLPVWRCDREEKHYVVIGGFAELSERLGKPLPAGFDPHKPEIDTIQFACRECGGTMSRLPPVIDAWFDSGAMPSAQWHYPFENQEEFRRHFPAEYICEGLDQTRGWFYSLLAIAIGVFDSPAYRHVIVNGLLLDAQGRKMSKHVGNVVDPWEAISQFGADAVRLYLLTSSQIGPPKRFDPSAIPEVASGFLTRLRNTYGFFALYAGDWKLATAPAPSERPLVDRWLLERLDRLVATVGGAWDGYDVTSGARAILDFCDADLSNWYVRVNRSRFWAPDRAADPAALATLHEALVTVSRLLAPAAPFLSDAIHRRLTGRSVHLERMPRSAHASETAWDAAHHGTAVASRANAMDAARRLATLARAARETMGLRVRQPIARMRVAIPHQFSGEAFEPLIELLEREVNVKKVSVVESDAELVRLKAKPNFRTLGKVYGKRTPDVARAAASLDQHQLRELESGRAVRLVLGDQPVEYRPEDVTVEREVLSDWVVQAEGPFVVALDPALTDDLVQEGLAREVVNRVQRLRKDAGYDYTTRIALGLSGPDEVLAAAGAHRSFIEGETLARQFTTGEDLADPDIRDEVDIDGRRVVISLRRHGPQPAGKPAS